LVLACVRLAYNLLELAYDSFSSGLLVRLLSSSLRSSSSSLRFLFLFSSASDPFLPILVGFSFPSFNHRRILYLSCSLLLLRLGWRIRLSLLFSSSSNGGGGGGGRR